MTLNERKKLEQKYYKWLNSKLNAKSSPMMLLTFLNENGNLIDPKIFEEFKVLEYSLQEACDDLIYANFPTLERKLDSHPGIRSVKFYKRRARLKVIKEKSYYDRKRI